MTTPITVQKLLAREGSSPKNASFYYETTEDQIDGVVPAERAFPSDIVSVPQVFLHKQIVGGMLSATLLARETSSPKNAAMMFEAGDTIETAQLYDCAEETSGTEDGCHMWGDENHNTRSDQKHRGGIAG